MEHRFERSGFYLGQVLWDDLVLAEFSLSVNQGQGSDQVNIDLASLCRQGRKHATHFELETHGDARFLEAASKGYSIHVALCEANAHRLVYDSKAHTSELQNLPASR